MEDAELNELSRKYDQKTLSALNARVDKDKAELEAKIKDGIKWGDKEHPLVEGDFVVGTVETLEQGRDSKTEHLTFVTIKGKCTVDKSAKVGFITLIANPVLKTAIKNGIVRVGNEVFIRFDGLEQGKKWDTPYKLYSVKLVEPTDDK